MNNSFVKLILSILLLSFIGSVHSETDRDRRENARNEKETKIKMIESLIGKEYWFDFQNADSTNPCSFHMMDSPKIFFPKNPIDNKPLQGTLTEIILGESVLNDPEIDRKLVLIKFTNGKTGYMRVSDFWDELHSLDSNRENESDTFMCVYPEEPSIFWNKLKEEKKIKNDKLLQQQKLQSKKPGVKIGMTSKDVIKKTSWGKPQSINKTTNQYGVHEQWIYGDGNYLYFENGRLTSIQN